MQLLYAILLALSWQGVVSDQNDEHHQVITRLRPPRWKDGRRHLKIPHSSSHANQTNEDNNLLNTSYRTANQSGENIENPIGIKKHPVNVTSTQIYPDSANPVEISHQDLAVNYSDSSPVDGQTSKDVKKREDGNYGNLQTDQRLVSEAVKEEPDVKIRRKFKDKETENRSAPRDIPYTIKGDSPTGDSVVPEPQAVLYSDGKAQLQPQSDQNGGENSYFPKAEKVLSNVPQKQENIEVPSEDTKQPVADAARGQLYNEMGKSVENPYKNDNPDEENDEEEKKIVQAEEVKTQPMANLIQPQSYNNPTIDPVKAMAVKKSSYSNEDSTGLSAEVKPNEKFPVASPVKVANHVKHFSIPGQYKRKKDNSSEGRSKSKKYRSKKKKYDSDPESSERPWGISNQISGTDHQRSRPYPKWKEGGKWKENGKWKEGGKWKENGKWKEGGKWKESHGKKVSGPKEVLEVSEPLAQPVKEELLPISTTKDPLGTSSLFVGPSESPKPPMPGPPAEPPKPPLLSLTQDYEVIPKAEEPATGNLSTNLIPLREESSSTSTTTSTGTTSGSSTSGSTSTTTSASNQVTTSSILVPNPSSPITITTTTKTPEVSLTPTTPPITPTTTSANVSNSPEPLLLKNTSVEGSGSVTTETTTTQGQGNDLSDKEINLHMGVTNPGGKRPTTTQGPSIKKLLDQMKSQTKKQEDKNEEKTQDKNLADFFTKIHSTSSPMINNNFISSGDSPKRDNEGEVVNKVLDLDGHGNLERLQESFMKEPIGRSEFSRADIPQTPRQNERLELSRADIPHAPRQNERSELSRADIPPTLRQNERLDRKNLVERIMPERNLENHSEQNLQRTSPPTILDELSSSINTKVSPQLTSKVSGGLELKDFDAGMNGRIDPLYSERGRAYLQNSEKRKTYKKHKNLGLRPKFLQGLEFNGTRVKTADLSRINGERSQMPRSSILEMKSDTGPPLPPSLMEPQILTRQNETANVVLNRDPYPPPDRNPDYKKQALYDQLNSFRVLSNATERMSDHINQLLVQRIAGQGRGRYTDPSSPYGYEDRRLENPKYPPENVGEYVSQKYDSGDKFLEQGRYRSYSEGKEVREINWNIENQGKQTIIIL